jgi:site-specific DNA-methyltransferase (adenine-specific)
MSTTPDLLTPRGSTTTGVFADAAGSQTSGIVGAPECKQAGFDGRGAGGVLRIAEGVTLILGDCMDAVKNIPSASVDMVMIDPPYSTPTVASFGRQVTKRLSDLAIQEYYFGALKPELERVLKHDAPLMIFCDDIYYAVLVGLFYDWKQINLLVWDKKRIGMGKPFRRRHECLFYANRGTPPLTGEMSHIPTILECPLTKEHHGAEKPLELCEQMIRELTPPGGCVVDLFMGSGTTGVAAVKSGRRFTGCELDPRYFQTARQRVRVALEECAFKLPKGRDGGESQQPLALEPAKSGNGELCNDGPAARPIGD